MLCQAGQFRIWPFYRSTEDVVKWFVMVLRQLLNFWWVLETQRQRKQPIWPAPLENICSDLQCTAVVHCFEEPFHESSWWTWPRSGIHKDICVMPKVEHGQTTPFSCVGQLSWLFWVSHRPLMVEPVGRCWSCLCEIYSMISMHPCSWRRKMTLPPCVDLACQEHVDSVCQRICISDLAHGNY